MGVHGVVIALIEVSCGFAPRHLARLHWRCSHLARVLILHDAFHAVIPLQLHAQPLRYLPGQLHDAVPPLPLVLRHPDVAHVPQEPEGQAGEHDQGARVDQEVAIEEAVQAHVAEDPDEKQNQAHDVKNDGEEKKGQAGSYALDQSHGGKTSEQNEASVTAGSFILCIPELSGGCAPAEKRPTLR